MKKLLVSALAVAGLTLTGCNDEEKNALSEQVKKQTQTIEQLNAQVNTLQRQVLDLAQHQAIQVEPEVLFQKSEVISPTKGTDDTSINKVEFDITMLKTNLDWLNALLLNEVITSFNVEGAPKIENKQQFIERLEKDMAEILKEAREYEILAAETRVGMEYL